MYVSNVENYEKKIILKMTFCFVFIFTFQAYRCISLAMRFLFSAENFFGAEKLPNSYRYLHCAKFPILKSPVSMKWYLRSKDFSDSSTAVTPVRSRPILVLTFKHVFSTKRKTFAVGKRTRNRCHTLSLKKNTAAKRVIFFNSLNT